jgi:hypothetical protein
MEGLKPLTALGWRCSTRGAGMHLLITHDDGEYARRVAAESGVDVATLGSYRRARPRGQDDGLLLRFGGLLIEDIRAAASVWSAPAGRHPESALQN